VTSLVCGFLAVRNESNLKVESDTTATTEVVSNKAVKEDMPDEQMSIDTVEGKSFLFDNG